MRVLEEYLAGAGAITPENAWQHVYRCLLWIDEAAHLAHIYDSNHMQRGGVFRARAVTFTNILCERLGVRRKELHGAIDYLFRGCVEEWRRTRTEPEVDPETESELIGAMAELLRSESLSGERADVLARRIEAVSRDFFTVGNKRKNALGEGFEDLLFLLLRRVPKVPASKIALRTPVTKLAGFRKTPPPRQGTRKDRQPAPDIAIHEGSVTHLITTAKWSMRQDRETQFQSEFSAFQRYKIQSTELTYALLTNEFDVARLGNVARAIPTGAGGYIFHTVRRQIIWDSWRLRLAECWPHLGVDIRRRSCGVGSGDVRWSCV